MPPDALSLYAESSRVEMYRQVIIASHRYAFSTPAAALEGTFIGAGFKSTCKSSKLAWARLSYLDETDVGALLTEALTADVEAVLADETSWVGADTAVSMSLAIVQTYAPLGLSASTSYCAALPTLLSYEVFPFGVGDNVPLAGALAVGPRTRIPDGLVRHIG